MKVSLFEGDAPAAVDAKSPWTHKDHAELEAELKWTAKAEAAAPAAGDVRHLRVEAWREPRQGPEPDDTAYVNVLVTQPRIRVMYVEGTIRPEYKFLRRRLETDPNVQPPRWRSSRPPGRRRAPGCSWCDGKGSGRRGGSRSRDRRPGRASPAARPR